MLLFSTKCPLEIATTLSIATSTPSTEASRYIQWALYSSSISGHWFYPKLTEIELAAGPVVDSRGRRGCRWGRIGLEAASTSPSPSHPLTLVEPLHYLLLTVIPPAIKCQIRIRTLNKTPWDISFFLIRISIRIIWIWTLRKELTYFNLWIDHF